MKLQLPFTLVYPSKHYAQVVLPEQILHPEEQNKQISPEL
jgi:hypothetical protein